MRADPNFDALIAKIYPCRDEYEAHQERVLAKLNKQITPGEGAGVRGSQKKKNAAAAASASTAVASAEEAAPEATEAADAETAGEDSMHGSTAGETAAHSEVDNAFQVGLGENCFGLNLVYLSSRLDLFSVMHCTIREK